MQDARAHYLPPRLKIASFERGSLRIRLPMISKVINEAVQRGAYESQQR